MVRILIFSGFLTGISFLLPILSRNASHLVKTPASALCSSISIWRNGLPPMVSSKNLFIKESGPHEKFPIQSAKSRGSSLIISAAFNMFCPDLQYILVHLAEMSMVSSAKKSIGMEKTPRALNFLGISRFIPGSKALYARPTITIVFSGIFSKISLPRFFTAPENSSCLFSALMRAFFIAFFEMRNRLKDLYNSFMR